MIDIKNTPGAKEHLDYLVSESAEGIIVTVTAQKGRPVSVEIELS